MYRTHTARVSRPTPGPGTAIRAYLTIQRLGGVGIANRPLLLLGVLLIALGIPIVAIGLVGEIMADWQMVRRPTYPISKVV